MTYAARTAQRDSIDSHDIDAIPLTGVFGARLENLDIASLLSPEMKDEIFALLKQYKLLVIPAQSHVDPAGLLAFAKIFGTPDEAPHIVHPAFPGLPAVKILRSSGVAPDAGAAQDKLDFGPPVQWDSWHTDGSTRTRDRIRSISILQAIDIPPWGRDTLFADMEAAYEGLSKPMRNMLSDLSAVHEEARDYLLSIGKTPNPPVVHPVVMEDPKTGRQALYVNRMFTRSIVELRPDEGENLLQFLYMQTHKPEYQARVTWTPGSIVVWENARTQHYLVQDARYQRIMHRVMVVEK